MTARDTTPPQEECEGFQITLRSRSTGELVLTKAFAPRRLEAGVTPHQIAHALRGLEIADGDSISIEAGRGPAS